ncbi:MAG: ROK family protein [Clostridia bacterium]
MNTQQKQKAYFPLLDQGFIPLEICYRQYLKEATMPVRIALERNDGYVSVFDTLNCEGNDCRVRNCEMMTAILRILLESRGGYLVTIAGNEQVADDLRCVFSAKGQRAFDVYRMELIYEHRFEIRAVPYEACPKQRIESRAVGQHLDGCRIGFDAGGTDRKVSAVINGQTVYSEEVIWHPKEAEDPSYHYHEILSAFQTAASKMPTVDAIGISSAGVYVRNRAVRASLFNKIKTPYPEEVKNIYLRAGKAIGNVPIEVLNDGDVTALAGLMATGEGALLGIAMGTSQAGGYVDAKGHITGWLNELAFLPIDCSEYAPIEAASGDAGIGSQYFSQDAVIRLAKTAGLDISTKLSLAEQLHAVQEKMELDDPKAKSVYTSIGCYLGHTLPLYQRFYDLKHVLLLGRVMSGKGGDEILRTCRNVLKAVYPDTFQALHIFVPDENFRRIGQSVAAASLPNIEGRNA